MDERLCDIGDDDCGGSGNGYGEGEDGDGDGHGDGEGSGDSNGDAAGNGTGDGYGDSDGYSLLAGNGHGAGLYEGYSNVNGNGAGSPEGYGVISPVDGFLEDLSVPPQYHHLFPWTNEGLLFADRFVNVPTTQERENMLGILELMSDSHG
jgi:hypothetical protein